MNNTGDNDVDEKLEAQMPGINKEIDDIMKGKEMAAETRRPTATLVKTTETIPATEAVPVEPTMRDHLVNLAGQTNLLHSYIHDRLNTLESKIDYIIARLG